MLDEQWDAFVIFVNTYYAVEEAYDSARRFWQKPAEGLDAFCRDGNPFLWDAQSSAEEELYEGFRAAFLERFEDSTCTAKEGYDFAREWLASIEGDRYGTALVESFDSITNEDEFSKACRPVAKQLFARASKLELTPQDVPEISAVPEPRTPSKADIEAVIQMLSHGDEAFAASLRERLASEDA